MAKHGKIKHHAKQHFVAQCYTKPWCDKDSIGQQKMTPYVWVFDRDGAAGSRKAPTNLFTETDIYTLVRADGQRDLTLEHGLCELEDKFTRIRNTTFFKGLWPDEEQMAWILAFVSTAHTRTKSFRDFHQSQWKGLRLRMEQMQQEIDQAGPEKRRQMSSLSLSNMDGGRRDKGISLEDVRKLEQDPLQALVAQALEIELPIMRQMSMAVMHTDDPVGFVTTDTPVMYFDPTAHQRQPIYRSPGLAWRSIEVSMPLSPQMCLILTHRPNWNGFFAAPSDALVELNRLRILRADQHFISCRNEVRPEWFVHPPMPDDAWEKVRERKIAAGEWPAPKGWSQDLGAVGLPEDGASGEESDEQPA